MTQLKSIINLVVMNSPKEKRKSYPNRRKKFKYLFKRAIILAALLFAISYFLAKLKSGQNVKSTEWMKYGVEMKIVFSNKTPNEKYYENVQFILPQKFKGQTDWHDYPTIWHDAKRKGNGEQGKPYFPKTGYKYRGQSLLQEYGLNTVVSDLISINRSVPDTRKLRCREKRYNAQLPSVSIIIVCQHEYPSVLKRTLHSIVNRSPGMLLMEIIIVQMHDDRSFLRNLEKYAKLKFPGLVKFIYSSKQKNVLLAKLEGAKSAIADVLVFLSPYVECNYNWLPPLLEPIVFNKHTVALPVSDSISAETFAYVPNDVTNRRVGFDWDLNQEYLPLLLPTGADKSEPYKDIIISGELFAIERTFFWTLGGFDEGISNNAVDELYELSFKTWMCGGQILKVPCSCVGVLDLKHKYKSKSSEENKKRIAEIWMDDYKNYVYENVPELYESINPGDLTLQKKLRQELKCRPFEWFLNAVAPDILEINPPSQNPNLAWGMLRLALYPELCLDSMAYEENRFSGLSLCKDDEHEREYNQNWRYSWLGNIQLMHKNLCLEVFEPPPNSTVYLKHCHYKGDSQTWMYDRVNKYFVHKKYENSCLDIIEMEPGWKLVINECDPNNVGMQWIFDNINEGAMKDFEKSLVNEKHWLV